MKQTLRILSMLLCACVMSFSFVSCGDDDDDDKNEPAPVETNLAAKVSGTYVGTGKLTLLGMEMDTFSGMKMTIRKSSNEYVLVMPQFADGTDFFQKETIFKILQTSDGSFVLTSDNNRAVKLEISKSGRLTYENPSVSVDGDSGYTLSFSGNKE